jgi:hypothetical protein
LHATEKIGRNLAFFRAAQQAKRVKHEIAAPHFARDLRGADQQQKPIHAIRIKGGCQALQCRMRAIQPKRIAIHDREGRIT